MRIAIIGAMPEEIDLLRDRIANLAEQRIGRRTYHVGQYQGHEVIVAFSRWGKVAAAATATTVITHFDVGLIIFTGVAGGVSDQLAIGDIVIGDRLIQHDVDASGTGFFQRFEIPLLGKTFFEVPPQLVEHALAAANEFVTQEVNELVPPATLAELGIDLPKVRVGTVASGDQFIHDKSKVRELTSAIPNLLCVEMEGAAVAQICLENDIPCIVIRSISDKADSHAALDFPKFVQRVASFYSFGVVTNFLKRLPVGK